VTVGAEIRAARRDFSRACIVGGLLAAIVFTWMLTIGRLDLLQSHGFGGFYDAQAHRLLGGHWDIPRQQLGFEAFIVDGKSYLYVGPWPAVLRMPVAAFTEQFDGRLTQVSIFAAFVVLLVATTRLLWRVRQLVFPAPALTRLDRWTAGLFVLVVGAGSVALFLASRPIVYHEAELWGAGFALAAFCAILDFVVLDRDRDIAWAGVFTALALLTRGSVGLAPVAALGIVLLGRVLSTVATRTRRQALRAPARWLGLGDRPARAAQLLALLAAIAVPLALYASVNAAKFGHPWRLPIADQVATQIDPIRPQIFAETNGSLFAAKFVPTNLVAAFRPDAIGVEGVFPWVTFPERPHELGGVTFAAIDPQASIPASMPFLSVLAVAGVFAVFRRSGRGSSLAALRVLVVGGLIGAVGVITIPFINHRYLSDFLPLLVTGAAAGLLVVVRRIETSRRLGSRGRGAAIGVLVVLAGASVWVNFALALQYQRAYSPFTSEAERAAFVRFQTDLDARLPGGSRMAVRRGPRLPEPGSAGTLFVIGTCDGVYWSDGVAWHPIERTAATGRYLLRATFPVRPAGTREAVLVAGPANAPDRLEVEYLTDDRVRFVHRSSVGATRAVTPGEPVEMEIVYDQQLPEVEVRLDGESVFGSRAPLPEGPVAVAGGEPSIRADFSGDAALEHDEPRFCPKLVQRSGTGSSS
jgi:cytochrome b561